MSKTYEIILKVTTPYNPDEWDWGALLGMDGIEERYSIENISEVEE